MRPQAPQQPNVYLKPGELAIACQPLLVETVLGSCVSVSLYCPFKGIGALCHAMLPTGDARDFKYVDSAINHMVKSLSREGVNLSTVVAKLFGGADMFASNREMGSAKYPVGEQNITKAREVLAHYRIKISNHDVGGVYGRKLLFFSDTGQVFIKKLSRKAVDMELMMSLVEGNECG